MTLPSTLRTRPQGVSRSATGADGFSLVELMVAVAVGLLVLAALSILFAYNSRARGEIENTSRQIENGRYALDLLRDDIHMAGYFAGYTGAGATRQFIDPCATALANLGWQASPTLMPLAISGYAGGDAVPNCITNQKSDTDVLIVRRVGTEPVAVAAAASPPAGSAFSANDFFMQTSGCSDKTIDPVPGATPFIIDAGSAGSGTFNLHLKDCASAAPVRKVEVHAYYVATCSNCSGGGDGIPTLRRVELSAGAASNVPLIEGVDSLRLDYLLDTNNDGQPDLAKRCKAGIDDCTVADWANVMAIRVNLLARNVDATPGYADDKTYDMGLAGPIPPIGDGYRRHLYNATIIAFNPAGLREQ